MEGNSTVVVCRLGVEDSNVLLAKTGIDGVGVSAVGTGKAFRGTALGHLIYRVHWYSQVPCLIEFGWWDGSRTAVPGLYHIFLFLGSFFSRVWGRPLSYGGEWWYVVCVVLMECWIRPVSCINVKHRSRTLGTECGGILIVNTFSHLHILIWLYSIMFLTFRNSTLWACARLWGANGPQSARIINCAVVLSTQFEWRCFQKPKWIVRKDCSKCYCGHKTCAKAKSTFATRYCRIRARSIHYKPSSICTAYHKFYQLPCHWHEFIAQSLSQKLDCSSSWTL